MFYMPLFNLSLCQILPKISHQYLTKLSLLKLLDHVFMTSVTECSKKPHGNQLAEKNKL